MNPDSMMPCRALATSQCRCPLNCQHDMGVPKGRRQHHLQHPALHGPKLILMVEKTAAAAGVESSVYHHDVTDAFARVQPLLPQLAKRTIHYEQGLTHPEK
jgi:hypothetical protein